jgi:hypothetical protein
MLQAFVAFLIHVFPWLSADYRARRIKPRQACPACGAVKKHAMRFDPVQKLVILACVCCGANWGYSPLINTTKFVKSTEE